MFEECQNIIIHRGEGCILWIGGASFGENDASFLEEGVVLGCFPRRIEANSPRRIHANSGNYMHKTRLPCIKSSRLYPDLLALIRQ